MASHPSPVTNPGQAAEVVPHDPVCRVEGGGGGVGLESDGQAALLCGASNAAFSTGLLAVAVAVEP